MTELLALLHLGPVRTSHLPTTLSSLLSLASSLGLTWEFVDFLLILLKMFLVDISLHFVVLLFLLFGMGSRRRSGKIQFL